MPSERDGKAAEIHLCAQIPKCFQDCFTETDIESQLPFTIYSPAAVRGCEKSNSKLITLLDDRILYLEQGRGDIEKTAIRYSNLSLIENQTLSRTMLVKLCGMSDEQKPATFIMGYCDEEEDLFQSLIQQIRSKAFLPQVSASEMENLKFNFLRSLNLKFMNFAKESLLSGENEVIFQPEFLRPYLRFFTRSEIKPHLEIYTNRELILLADENEELKKKHKGGFWCRYIPIGKVELFQSEPLAIKPQIILQKIGVADSELIGVLYHNEIRKSYNPIKITYKEG